MNKSPVREYKIVGKSFPSAMGSRFFLVIKLALFNLQHANTINVQIYMIPLLVALSSARSSPSAELMPEARTTDEPPRRARDQTLFVTWTSPQRSTRILRCGPREEGSWREPAIARQRGHHADPDISFGSPSLTRQLRPLPRRWRPPAPVIRPRTGLEPGLPTTRQSRILFPPHHLRPMGDGK